MIADGTIPIGMQLREQLRWLMATEQLKPGDSLPSVRDLSDQLGVARITLNAVYTELREQGLVRMGRGRGTEVANSDAVRQLARLKRLLAILDTAFDSAMAEGFSAQEVAVAAQVRGVLLTIRAKEQDAIVYVDDPAHEADTIIRRIREITGLPVRFVPLDQAAPNPTGLGERIVTTCFGWPFVQAIVAPETEIVVLGLSIRTRMLLDLMQYPAGAVVLFVGRKRSAVVGILHEAERAGVDQVQLEALGLDDPAAAERLRQADHVYALCSAYDEVLDMVSPGCRVHRLELALESAGEASLLALAQRHMCCKKG